MSYATSMPSKYSKKLIGQKCYLSPVRMEDADKYVEWLNDMEVSVNLRAYHMQISMETEREYLEKFVKNQVQDYFFGIIDKSANVLIGNCALMNPDFINRNAELGIFVGDKNYWGKGIGTEAIMLLLDFGFNVLNLNNIWLNFVDFNTKSKRIYEKCGFKIIGRRREAKIIGNLKFDIVYMDILAEEYKSVYIKNLLHFEP
ncbi:MAG: GNAT family protein [Cytophagales bacterium]|nr:GNAT family protein [Cytophagales bacterium]